MADSWARLLSRWTDAGLIDPATAERIRAFELTHTRTRHLSWPVGLALAFGALMLGAGILLFVSAQWDFLSPAARFALTLLLVAIFHAAAALVVERFPAMSTALHAIGTVALGAGIFLAGQIFNLDEHWPGGLMLWALGAGAAWWILRSLPQFVLLATLTPAWLAAEWMAATDNRLYETADGTRVLAVGIFLLTLAYLTAIGGERARRAPRALMWLGAFTILQAAGALAASSSYYPQASSMRSMETSLRGVGWIAAIGLPLAVGFATRGMQAWPLTYAAAWALLLFPVGRHAGELALYPWWALGAVGLIAWGVRDARSERINFGAAILAATVGVFYFSRVMDNLGRSASLIGVGLLTLAGGWALERLRRALIRRAREVTP